MDFSFTPEQQHIRDAVLKQCAQFSDAYWLGRDRDAIFPHEFFRAMVEGRWLARERIVFDRPIGMNQGIQHPLAKCWAQLEAASLMVMQAATLFDKGQECGVEANAGKYLAAECGLEACHTAMLTLGGMGYAEEYHIERYLRECLIPRTAPVSPHMIPNFLAEKVLNLAKSY